MLRRVSVDLSAQLIDWQVIHAVCTAKRWLTQCGLKPGVTPETACAPSRTIKVSLHAFTTLDISAVLSHYGRTFTPFRRNPSLPPQTKPNLSCPCEETLLRLQHSDGHVGICQSMRFSPSSSGVMRVCVTSILFIGWSFRRDRHQDLSPVETRRPAFAIKANILLSAWEVFCPACN